jgi:hypothetical protein
MGWVAAAIGGLCIFDALKEGICSYQYQNAIPLLTVYKGILGIYTTARQGHQWTDPDAQQTSLGHIFIYGWAAVYVILAGLEIGRFCYPPPAQPFNLDNTFNWVIGYYVFGKASALARLGGLRPFGLGKRLDARKAVRALASGADTPQPLPIEKVRIMDSLRKVVDLLGGICLFEVLYEGISFPNRCHIDLHYAYRLVLAAYAGTNQWRKWTGAEPDVPRSSRWWLYAWGGVFVILKYLSAIDSSNIIVMPWHLTGTALWVFAIYLLGFTSDMARTSGFLSSLGLGLGKEPTPIPEGPQPKPVDPRPQPPQPTPKPEPPVSDNPPSTGGQDEDDGAADTDTREQKIERTAIVCEQLGEFGFADVAAAANITYKAARHWVEVLVKKGWVEKIGYGRYRWKGRGDNA